MESSQLTYCSQLLSIYLSFFPFNDFQMLNFSGDEDLCYYNFMCAHPFFAFSDFNHIFSNIGYIFMGFLFLFATFYRQQVVPFRFVSSQFICLWDFCSNSYFQEVGIPVHYGIFYAMGVALIIEGLLSACYHICPSQSNYQFGELYERMVRKECSIDFSTTFSPFFNTNYSNKIFHNKSCLYSELNYFKLFHTNYSWILNQ